MKRTKQQGFTLIELILVIAVLGILAVMAMPQFIDIVTEAEISSSEGVAGGVRAGIMTEWADDLVANGAPGVFPATLDGAAAGPAGLANPFFGNVLQNGVTDASWSKAGLIYTFDDGTTTYDYTYVPASGDFAGPT